MTLPLLLEPEALLPMLDDSQLLIIDTGSRSQYLAGHIPGAVHISPSRLQSGVKPATGKLPSKDALSELFAELGLTQDRHVIATDDEGGGWAGRLIWTLDCIGHRSYSLLNGGTVAWLGEGYPIEQTPQTPARSDYTVSTIDPTPIASLEAVLQSIEDPAQAIWDARSPGEFEGSKVVASRGGHIPGARLLEWTELMDTRRNLRLLPLPQIQTMLDQRGLGQDKSIITHCHSHHRSGLTYIAAKLLGYTHVKAYDGSWGEWGNREDTPIECPAQPRGNWS